MGQEAPGIRREAAVERHEYRGEYAIKTRDRVRHSVLHGIGFR